MIQKISYGYEHFKNVRNFILKFEKLKKVGSEVMSTFKMLESDTFHFSRVKQFNFDRIFAYGVFKYFKMKFIYL